MKKIVALIGIVLLLGAVAAPAVAAIGDINIVVADMDEDPKKDKKAKKKSDCNAACEAKCKGEGKETAHKEGQGCDAKEKGSEKKSKETKTTSAEEKK